MTNRIELNEAAIQDLSKEAQVVLKAFIETKSDKDLGALIAIVLTEFTTDITPQDITNDTNFITGLDLDSLAITEFIFLFEDLFNLKISNENLLQLQTVGDFKQFIFEQFN
tara:strand:+ start:218 stop:550 length:333 start_codon:yes stop_codon:yes gene_type:complete